MKWIDMAMNLDHELCLTRPRSRDMKKIEANLFMIVSRPPETNWESRKAKYAFVEVADKKNMSKIGGDQVETGFQRELNGRPGKDQGRPNQRHLDLQIGQTKYKTSISSYYGGQVYMLWAQCTDEMIVEALLCLGVE